jgi:hypothetical protein
MSLYQAVNEKFRMSKAFAGLGVLGNNSYITLMEHQMRVVVQGVGGGNVVTVRGRILGSPVWDTLGTITGVSNGQNFDISTYDEVQFECTTYSASGSPAIYASGFIKRALSSGSGTVTDAANDGTGLGLFKSLISGILHFKTILAGWGILLSSGSDEITITLDEEQLTYTKNLIQFNKTVADGYTYVRYNAIIDTGYGITVDSGGEFIVP